MALKSTIYKAELQISDLDRHFYQTCPLTLARHPSETDERMMLRVLAFALNADERLTFAKGLSDSDEPDLWQMDLTGAVEKWIELGQPDEKRLRQACGRAREVIVYSYSGASAENWWRQNEAKFQRFDNLAVYNLDAAVFASLASLAERTMRLSCTIQDGEIWLSSDNGSVQVPLASWKTAR